MRSLVAIRIASIRARSSSKERIFEPTQRLREIGTLLRTASALRCRGLRWPIARLDVHREADG